MINICAIAVGIENYKSTVGKIEKKHYEIVLLARSKLNRTVVLNSKALVDEIISYDELILTSNVLKEYDNMDLNNLSKIFVCL